MGAMMLQVPDGMPPKARRYVNSGTYIGRAHSIQAILVRCSPLPYSLILRDGDAQSLLDPSRPHLPTSQ